MTWALNVSEAAASPIADFTTEAHEFLKRDGFKRGRLRYVLSNSCTLATLVAFRPNFGWVTALVNDARAVIRTHPSG